MENLGEYDRIAQTIEISNETIYLIGKQRQTEQFRKYIHKQLAHSLAEKLLESGYISETWIKKENSEECTIVLYVKPLIKK